MKIKKIAKNKFNIKLSNFNQNDNHEIYIENGKNVYFNGILIEEWDKEVKEYINPKISTIKDIILNYLIYKTSK